MRCRQAPAEAIASRTGEPAPSAPKTTPNGAEVPSAKLSLDRSKSTASTRFSNSTPTRPVSSAASSRMALRSRRETEWITSCGLLP